MHMQDMRYDQHFAEVMQILTTRGLFLTSAAQGKTNTMIIGWGLVGSVWGKPVWTVLVRPSRYTYQFIEQSGEFTISVPGLDLERACKVCGSVSGRDRDKLAEAGLRAVPARKVKSPVIDGCIAHYECRVLHSNDVQPGSLVQQIISGAYRNGDFHRVYWGEILASYVDADRLAELRA